MVVETGDGGARGDESDEDAGESVRVCEGGRGIKMGRTVGCRGRWRRWTWK